MMQFIPLAVSLLSVLAPAAAAPVERSISHGPAMPPNFPDPALMQDGTSSSWYAYATNDGVYNVPLAHSDDFATFTPLNRDALPRVGKWSNGANIWAPDVLRLRSGKYVMYYTAEAAAKPGTHCVGVATSDRIDGPFMPRDEAFVCSFEQGGAIDPSGFIDDDGKTYVLYKIDGNNIGHGGLCGNGVAPIVPTPIMIQEVRPEDGFTPIGGPRVILDRGPADGPLVEAPVLIKKDCMYVLFFSSGCYTSDYDTSYATSVNGIFNNGQQYQKSAKPLLVTGTYGLNSPGGMDVAPDGRHVVFHADNGPNNFRQRQLYTGLINVDRASRTVTI